MSKLLYFLLFCLINATCKAQKNTVCAPFSCGDLHDITYPFRLKTDPATCGSSKYELECVNNRALVTLNSKKFNVLAINYANYSIRLVDPSFENNNNCSLPSYSLSYDDLPILDYTRILEYNVPVTFISCSKPRAVTTSALVDNSFCGNGSSFGYVEAGKELKESDLLESCRVDSVTMVSINGPTGDNKNSLSGIHRVLEYGFELSWYRAMCQECESTYGYCSLDESNAVTCEHYCREDVPLSKLGFRCQFEFYVGFGVLFLGMGLGGLVGLRLLIGVPCLIVLVVYKWRRRNLSGNETIEMKSNNEAGSSATSAQV